MWRRLRSAEIAGTRRVDWQMTLETCTAADGTSTSRQATEVGGILAGARRKSARRASGAGRTGESSDIPIKLAYMDTDR